MYNFSVLNLLLYILVYIHVVGNILCPQVRRLGCIFFSCLSFCPLSNFNLANIFWKVSARALIFHMSIFCEKIFPCSNIFYPVNLTLEFYPFSENFNLANIFWTASARALIFHISIPCDKTFPCVLTLLTLWPWPWNFACFLKH